MSLTTASPAEPQTFVPVPATTLSYFRTRNKIKAFTLIHKEFARGGITQADLAARLGKDETHISRLLAAPGNWTLDTISELLFAISGAEPDYGISYPLKKARRNQRKPATKNDAGDPYYATKSSSAATVSNTRSAASQPR